MISTSKTTSFGTVSYKTTVLKKMKTSEGSYKMARLLLPQTPLMKVQQIQLVVHQRRTSRLLKFRLSQTRLLVMILTVKKLELWSLSRRQKNWSPRPIA